MAARVLRRPRLWTTALRQGPILTTPAWRAFRLETQYGNAAHVAAPDDVVAWLEWCRSWRRSVPLPGGSSRWSQWANARRRARAPR